MHQQFKCPVLFQIPGISKVILIVLLLSANMLFAQETAGSDTTQTTAITIGLHNHYGFIISHSSKIRQVANSNPWGVELDVSFHFTNRKAWEYLQGYPRLGASLTYFNFNNPEVLGNGYSLLVFSEPFLSAHKKFSLSFRLGLGLTYLDTPYHPETNPENLFYSTSISFPLVANLMANYRIHERFLLRAGGTYNHISNGGMQQPNKGINYPTFTAGINYTLRPSAFPEREPSERRAVEKKRHYLFALMGGAKDRWQSDNRKLPVLGLAAYASQRVGNINGLVAGFEWVADFTIREELRDKGIHKDFLRGAILAGHEFLIGRFRFSQVFGLYLYAPHKARDRVYQRYGLEYQTGKRLFFGVNLKAHRHVADFFDIRTGIRF